ncbi:uncharacterized protein [Watersipora subatra]|uniref:uncharacterized protein n=1 Tax=Watersipora subatra TaxID=2589382 RepID=UPI00355BD516
MSSQLLDALGLVPASQNGTTDKKHRPLTLEINLKPQPCKEVASWTPKTPRSMLSPLTPKLKKPDFFRDGQELSPTYPSSAYNVIDYDSDPTLALMMLDLTSKLGQRLSLTLEGLVSTHVWTITRDYDKYCNQPKYIPDPDVRRLRSFEGKTLPIYRKRVCHRYVNRKYLFKALDKKERRKTLLAGGLNKTSRHLLRKMKPCIVIMEKLTSSKIFSYQEKCIDPILRLLLNPMRPVVTLNRIKVQENREDTRRASETQTNQFTWSPKNSRTSSKSKELFVVVTPRKKQKSMEKLTIHRKSVRRRVIPRRLLHII